MPKKNISFLISGIIILALSFSSCKSILGWMYGVKNIDRYDMNLLSQEVSDNSIFKQGGNYYLDSDYVNKAYDRYADSASLLHDALQPMQVLYFDSLGHLVSWHINCYAGGFPNLKWNRGNVFATFPPKTQRAVTTLVQYNDIAACLKPLKPFSQSKPKPSSAKITIVVFWNYKFFRQSKRLMDLVLKNRAAHHAETTARILFVNTDFMYQAIAQ